MSHTYFDFRTFEGLPPEGTDQSPWNARSIAFAPDFPLYIIPEPDQHDATAATGERLSLMLFSAAESNAICRNAAVAKIELKQTTSGASIFVSALQSELLLKGGHGSSCALPPSTSDAPFYVLLREHEQLCWPELGWSCQAVTSDEPLSSNEICHLVNPSMTDQLSISSSAQRPANEETDEDEDEYDRDVRSSHPTTTVLERSAAAMENAQVYSTAPNRPQNSHPDPSSPATTSITAARRAPLAERSVNIPLESEPQVLETPIKRKMSTQQFDRPSLVIEESKIEETQSEAGGRTTTSTPVPTALEDQATIPTQPLMTIEKRKRKTPTATTPSTFKKPRKRIRTLIEATETGVGDDAVLSDASPPIEMPAAARTIIMTSSKYKDNKPMLTWLRKHNITLMKEIPKKKMEYTCVVSDGDLALTGKLLRSLVLGCVVVTDEWLTASRKADALLERGSYLQEDLAPTLSLDRKLLFSRYEIYFTSTLHSELSKSTGRWEDFRELCTSLGADVVKPGTLSSFGDDVDFTGSRCLLLATGPKDADAKEIVKKTSCKAFTKDVLIQSVKECEQLSSGARFRINF